MNIRFLLFVATPLLLNTFHAIAVTAKPGLIAYSQPDGTTVTICLSGDEHSHIYTDAEGNVLIDSCNTLYFATKDGDGIKASPYRACDRHQRSDDCRKFLSTLNKAAVRQNAERGFRQAKKAGRRTSSINGKFGLIPGATFPVVGRQKALVILVEFADTHFNSGYDARQYFFRLLNAPGFDAFGATGSARDYFIENSKGAFEPEFDLYGPVRLQHPAMFYGANDINGADIRPEQMVIEACRSLDDEIDFSEYDRDNDGIIDNVFVFYAGRGEASGGLPTTIWPHAWNIPTDKDPVVLDGKLLSHYACTNEWDGTKPDGIGTFLHEFSHVLGLPDLYSTNYSGSFTPGRWDLMDAGSYNNDSRTPPLMSTFERFSLGWSEPRVAAGTQPLNLLPLSESDGIIIPGDDTDEMFFVENRQQKGWDSFVPGHGMLVWHVCYNSDRWGANGINNDPGRQLVDIVEAIDNLSDDRRDGHTFPGSDGVTELSEASHPAFSWSKGDNRYSIGNISENSGKIMAMLLAPHQPIAQPVLSVSRKSHSQVTVCWDASPDIQTYKISVSKGSSADGQRLGRDFRLVDVGNSGDFTISGLSPSTAYSCRLYACQDNYMSAASEPQTFFTDEAPFGGERPNITEINDIRADAFSIAWNPVADSDGYLVTLLRRYANGTMNQFEGFSSDGSMKTGWNTSTTMKSSDPKNCGAEVPSLLFKQFGGQINSPEYSEDISAVSFWAVAKSSNGAFFGNPSVTVYGSDGGDWTEIGAATIRVDTEGSVHVFDNLPNDIRRLRLRVNGVPRTDCFIDDISVDYGVRYATVSVDGFPITVFDSNGIHITGLTRDTEYLCTIEAFKDDVKSLPSDTVSVFTADEASVVAIEPDSAISVTSSHSSIAIKAKQGTTVTLFSIDGKAIGAKTTSAYMPEVIFYGLPPGIYIIRAGTMVQKHILI